MNKISQDIVPKEQKFRFPELDCLRGIAVLIIMLHHYTFGYDFHYNLMGVQKFYLYHGNLAVQLFFIISGFVIFLTLNRTTDGVDFIISRFSRLYPAYWSAMILTLLFVALLPTPTFPNHSLTEIVLHFTMLQGFTNFRLIDTVYWTLKIELIFYGIMFVLFLCKKLNRINIFCAFWLLLSLLSISFEIPFKKYLDVLLILEFSPLFIAGICFYQIKMGKDVWYHHVLILSGYCIHCIWLITHPEDDIYSFIVLAACYVIFYFFVYKGLSFLNNRILLFFGSISYSLYLIHNVIGHLIIYKVRGFINLRIVYVSIPVVICVFIAYCLSKYIEKPALKFIRSQYKKYKQTQKKKSNLYN